MKNIVMLTLSCLLLVMATNALADPPPGNPKLPAPDGVFCIQPTLIEDIAGGDTRIAFEVVNWNHDVADALNLAMGFGTNQTLPGTTIVSAGLGSLNDWTLASTPSSSLAQFGVGAGTSIPNIDLAPPFTNPFAPMSPDIGPNTRRDFEVVVNGWGPSERLVLNWDLFLPIGPDPDSFDSGIWSMDRSSDPFSAGSLVRITTWEQPRPSPTNGFPQFNFEANPINPVLTDQNATTFGVPEPSSLLLASCLLASAGCLRRQLR